MHLHQSLVDGQGQNVFSAPDGSATARFAHYIGGLQRYTPDLMLVYAPFVNSYRRYVTGSQAPVNLHWGLDNRTTGLRVPISEPAARRVENRIAGADANPYLAIAATLILFRSVNRTAFWLLVPYLAWVTFAAILNGTLWRMNS
jgi:glutamine synthetase